jgi:hypothetical protein
LNIRHRIFSFPFRECRQKITSWPQWIHWRVTLRSLGLPRWRTKPTGEWRKAMKIKRTIVALASVAALSAATMAVPTKAEATPAWVLPALIIGGVVVGTVAVASAAAHSQAYYPAYSARGQVYVQPTVRCHWVQQMTIFGPRTIQVCG